MYHKIEANFNNDLKGKTFAFWGASFKPKTDDIRESAAIDMAIALAKAGAKINFYDPEAASNFEEHMQNIDITKGMVTRFNNKYDCLNGASGLVLMTEWPEFRAPDFMEIKSRLETPNLFDTRNIYPTSKVLESGINYFAIGKRINENWDNTDMFRTKLQEQFRENSILS